MNATKYEIATEVMHVSIEKLAVSEGEDRQWIAGARSTDPKRQRATVFAGTAREAGASLVAELRRMADALEADLKHLP